MRLSTLFCSILLAGCALPVKAPDSLIYEGTQAKVEKMLEHGTGVIYFGFEECPWCVEYRPLLEDMAEEGKIEVMHYDIHKDKEKDREWYDEIAEELSEMNEDMIRYDNDGNAIIYMPLTVFVHDGEVIGYEDETCDLSSKEHDPKTYWTEEKKSALAKRVVPLMKEVKSLQEEKNSQGCAIKESPGC